MVVTMLTGWTGRLQAAPVGGPWSGRLYTPPALKPARLADEAGMTYAVQPVDAETIRLTVGSPELTLQKTVHADGRTHVALRRGSDAVTVTTARRSVSVTRGRQTIVVDLNTFDETRMLRVRGLLLRSRAVRLGRALAASLEETGAHGSERLAVRLTGAMLGCLDGDDDAFRRAARELVKEPAMPVIASDVPQAAAVRFEYQQALVNARASLVGCSGPFFWNPLQAVCGFAWLHEVEQAWFHLVAHILHRSHQATEPVALDASAPGGASRSPGS